jgi:cell division protein FtsQ
MTPANRRVKRSLRFEELSSAGPQASHGSPSSQFSGGVKKKDSRLLSAATTILGIGGVCAASFAIAWSAHRYVTRSTRFAVTQIDVVGAERRPMDGVVAESGLTLGTNIFSVDVDATRSRILSDPWIADASVSRKLPGTLIVRVVERKAVALVAAGDLFLAAADGSPFKRLEAVDSVDLPIVTGVRAEDFAEDPAGAARTVRRAIDLAAEFQRGSLSKRLPLQEVHVMPEGTFALVVGQSATELQLGPPPFRRKLEQAAHVVSELDRRGAKADAVLLDNDTRPDRVVVRLR